MPTETDFLAAIHAEPDDATHKLVFADWLEERSDPRAACLRTLVEWQQRAREGDPDVGAPQDSLGADLPPDLFDTLRSRGRLEFARGGLLCQTPTTTPDTWAESPDAGWVTELDASECRLCDLAALLARFPLRPAVTLRVESAALPATPEEWDGLAGLDAIRDLTVILDPGLADRLVALAGSIDLAGLTDLAIIGRDLGDEDIAALAAWPVPAWISTLHVKHCAVTDAGLVRFAAGGPYWRLRELYVACRIGPVGGLALAESPALAGLTTLHLGGTFVDDDVVEALASGPLAPTMEFLDLTDTPVGERAALALTPARFPRLRQLRIDRTLIQSAGLRRVRSAFPGIVLGCDGLALDLPTLAGFLPAPYHGVDAWLNLPSPEMAFLPHPGPTLTLRADDPETLAGLGSWPTDVPLAALYLEGFHLDRAVLDAVRGCIPDWTGIELFGLIGPGAGWTLTADAAAELARLLSSPEIRLGLIDVSARVIRHLAETSLWGRVAWLGAKRLGPDVFADLVGRFPPGCRTLVVEDATLDDADLRHLRQAAERSALGPLREVSLLGPYFTEDGPELAGLRERLPDVRMQRHDPSR